MKYLLSILCLFVFSCDSDDDTHGCLDSQACNYNPNASIDNNSCIYEEEGYDCDGNNLCGDDPIGWMTGACGDCDSGIYDCEGICDGDAEIDECGECGGDNCSSQFFQLNEGYNLLSFNILPQNMSIVDIFNDYLNDGIVMQIFDEDSNFVYLDENFNLIDEIGIMALSEAYNIKLSQPAEIEVLGALPTYPIEIELTELI